MTAETPMTEVARSHRLRFGEFAADLTTGELFQHGAKVPLQEKPFRLLGLLLQHPKQLLSRHDIIHAVWPDTFVEGDVCLNVAIRRLRSALKEDASHPRFVETVGSHGYRFIANVHGFPSSEQAPPTLKHPRVAIFPLKTFSGSESSTFAPGLTELLIIQLRQLNPPFIVVTPEFTTERAHKGRGTLSLCRQACVDFVLVGAVSETAGQVRVNVRLLDCAAQACIWAQSYVKQDKLALFAVQEELSRNIASAVIQSLPNVAGPLVITQVPPTAQQKYVQACHLLARLTETAIERCVPIFEDAVRD